MHNPALTRPGAGLLAGVTAWRSAVAASAFVGLGGAVATTDHPWSALSQQANLFAGVVYLGLAVYPLIARDRAYEPRSPWLRGATTVLLALVCVTYLTVIEGSLDSTWSLLEHLITPLAVLADFVLVGRNQANVRWWHPLTWVLLPAVYLGYYLIARPGLYDSFLDPDADGFLGVVAAFLVAILAAGYALYGIARARTWWS